LIPVISGIIAYVIIQHGTKYYQGRELLIVSPSFKQIKDQTPDLITIRLGGSYSKLLKQENFLANIAQRFNGKLSTEELNRSLVILLSAGTPFFEVRYVDTNPERTLQVLDTIVEMLTNETPLLKELRQKVQKQFIAERRTELISLIDKGTKEITSLESQRGVRGEVIELNAQLDFQIRDIKNASDAYTAELQALSKFESDGSEANQIHVIEKSSLISGALGPQPRNAALAMGLISLFLTILLITFLQRISGRILDEVDLRELTGWEILTRLSQFDDHEKLELLTSELMLLFEKLPQTEKRRVLVVCEQNVKSSSQILTCFSAAIQQFGYSVEKITEIQSHTNVGNIREDPEIYESVPINTFEDNGVVTVLPVKTSALCELVSLRWPTTLSALGKQVFESDCVLILLSLRYSKRANILKLTKLNRASSFRVLGVILV